MNFGLVAGDTNATIYVRLRDSTTGLGQTGLVFNSAGAVCSYTLPLAARAAITLATQTVTGAHTDGGFVEVDATNCKGLYRLDLPDAAIASGDYTIISIEFDGIIEESVMIELLPRPVNVTQLGGSAQSATDLQDFADAGYDPGTNKVQGVVLVDTLTTYTGNTVQTGDSFALIGTAGAGLTNINLPNQTMDITGNLSGSVGSVTGAVGSVTGAVGSVAGNVDGNVTGSVGSLVGHTVQTGDSFALIGTAGAGLTNINLPNQTMDIVGNITGNLSGSVGSVTGAVGSVTGAVGSVTGAVGSVAGNVDGNVTGSVGSLVGHTVQTGDNFPRLGAPAGASVSADIAALNDVAATDIVSAGAITTLAGAVVNVDLVDTLTTYTGNTPQTADNDTKLTDIQSRLPAALISGRMSSDVEAINDNTEAAVDLRFSAGTIVRGTAQTGTLSVTVMTSDVAETTDDHFIGRIIIWTSGVLKDQATDITDYSGTNGTFTYTATTEAPSNGDTFVVV